MEFSDELPLQTTIKPRSFKIVDSLTVDDFVATSSKLETQLLELNNRS